MTDLHPVAAAYREVRRTGALDLPARQAAEDAYRRLHPPADADTGDKETARIVAAAARPTPETMWNGVGSYQMGRQEWKPRSLTRNERKRSNVSRRWA